MPIPEPLHTIPTAEEILTMSEKIRQNQAEQAAFSLQLHKLLDGDQSVTNKPLVIGKTPNALAICGADSNLEMKIKKSVIDKSMRPEIRDETGRLVGKTGHGLTQGQLLEALNQIRTPVMILQGSREDSLVAITDVKDNKGRDVVAAVELHKAVGFDEINHVTSIYGRENIVRYISEQMEQGKLLAINREKADELLHSIGKSYPKENTIISFDNSIAYSAANVKYPAKEIEKSAHFYETSAHEKLLPFLNAKASYHESRLKTLSEKHDTQTAKLEKNQIKIQTLTAKAEKYEDLCRFLETAAVKFAPAKSMLERLEKKVKTIRTEKIPARQEKVKAHQSHIETLNRKSHQIGHKLERVQALNDTIKSFGLTENRRQAFSQNMNRLHQSTRTCLQDKLTTETEKLHQAQAAYKNLGHEEKLSLRKEINARQETCEQLQKRVERLGTQIDFTCQEETVQDAAMKEAVQVTAVHAEKESVNISSLSEEICVKSSEAVRQAQREQTSEIASEPIPAKSAESLVKTPKQTMLHPEFYQTMPRTERYTQRMHETQARETAQRLEKAGIEYSAVFSGEKSGITIRQTDYKRAASLLPSRQPFGKTQLEKSAKASKEAEQQSPPEQAKEQAKKKDETAL